MAELDTWAPEVNDLTAPKPLQMAKALRMRKRALAQAQAEKEVPADPALRTTAA